MWHVHVPDATVPVEASANKLDMVAWACEQAKNNGGTVQVRDVGGAIELVYTYVDGVEHVQRVFSAKR